MPVTVDRGCEASIRKATEVPVSAAGSLPCVVSVLTTSPNSHGMMEEKTLVELLHCLTF